RYHEQLLRSVEYGLATTIICIAISYPMAYWIAFKGGTRKSTYLMLVVLPLFVAYVLRTIAWKNLLASEGFLVTFLQNHHLGSAISFTLMIGLLIGIFAYAKALGTEDVLEAAAA